MAWNRYGYVKYNPQNFIDPTGHMVDEEGSYNPWKKTVRTEDGLYDLENDVWLSHRPLVEENRAVIITFEFEPALFKGGPGAVTSYADLAEEGYNDFSWGGGFGSMAETLGLINSSSVWLRDNTNILYLTSGYWHITGQGNVTLEKTIDGYNGSQTSIFSINLDVVNNTYNPAIVDNIVLNKNDSRLYNLFTSTCPIDMVGPEGGHWRYSFLSVGSGEYSLIIRLSSRDTYSLTSAQFTIPNQ